MFELANLANQPQVVRQEWRAGFELTLDQRSTNKYVARSSRIDWTEGDTTLRIDDQPIERCALECHNFSALLLPMRIGMAPLQQMRADPFKPSRLDRRERSCIKPRRLDQFRGDDPSSCFFQQRRAGPNKKLYAARSRVRRLAALGIDNADAYIAQQSGQQCNVNLLERCCR